jgi:deoxyxylulose-5-phosphate synthase
MLIIVILNDNEMSISPNVGAPAPHARQMRLPASGMFASNVFSFEF